MYKVIFLIYILIFLLNISERCVWKGKNFETTLWIRSSNEGYTSILCMKDILVKSMTIVSQLKIAWEIQEVIFNRAEKSWIIVPRILKLQVRTWYYYQNLVLGDHKNYQNKASKQRYLKSRSRTVRCLSDFSNLDWKNTFLLPEHRGFHFCFFIQNSFNMHNNVTVL